MTIREADLNLRENYNKETVEDFLFQFKNYLIKKFYSILCFDYERDKIIIKNKDSLVLGDIELKFDGRVFYIINLIAADYTDLDGVHTTEIDEKIYKSYESIVNCIKERLLD